MHYLELLAEESQVEPFLVVRRSTKHNNCFVCFINLPRCCCFQQSRSLQLASSQLLFLVFRLKSFAFHAHSVLQMTSRSSEIQL